MAEQSTKNQTNNKETPILYIEARKNIKNIDLSQLKKITDKKPKTISLASTIQYINYIPIIKKHLEQHNINVKIKQGSGYKAHVLGCQPYAFDKDADILLLLADGKFHAINNASILENEIYVFNPSQAEKLEKINHKDIEKIKAIKKTTLKKFFSSDNIGIIISQKPGQKISEKQLKDIKTKIKKLNKNIYIFYTNNINISELDNFPFIKSWINTACPGIFFDDKNKKIINYSDLSPYLSKKSQ